MRLNTAHKPAQFTHEGAPAKHINPVQQLRRLVMSCLLWEREFYVDGKTIADQIVEACAKVPPKTIADIAVEARSQMNLRHVPLLLARELLRHGGQIAGNTVAQVIQRPDEMGELVAIYWKDGRTPLSAQLKRGLRMAFDKFDEYQLAKYAQAGAVRLRDVMFLVHPKPKNLAEAWAMLADDKLSAQDAGTWEARLSAGEDKREVFTELLRENKLGYLALLRNLRNMDQAGVDADLVHQSIIARKGADRVLPFRYIAAATAAPRYVNSLDQALFEAVASMPVFDGETIILVDVSGSMDHQLSGKSDMTRMHAAAALASIWPGRKRVFSFSNDLVEVPGYPGLAGVDAIIRSQGHGGTYLGGALHKVFEGFFHDRLVVITDEQSHDRVPDPVNKRSYMINVASSRNGVGYGRWTHVDGFSESVLRWMREYENDA